MGLDVYVGTLTRYYSGEWETVVQKAGRELGMAVTIERLHDPPDAIRDPFEIAEAVAAWRAGLNEALVPHLSMPLEWAEGMDPPYFTDKPTWDCYSALLIWAAHEENPGFSLPAIAPDDWTTDAAVQRSSATDFKSRYGQLLYDAELWLPGDFDFTFQTSDLVGNTASVGSTRALHQQLTELNRRTWQADERTLASWRKEGAEHGGPFEISARFAFAVFLELSRAAVDHGLPVKLDY